MLTGSNLFAQVANFDSLAVKAGFEKPYILSLRSFENSVSDELLSTGELLAKFSFPATGKVISQFGIRSGRNHTGTDIKMYLGDTIYAAYNGFITCSQYRSGYGNLVVIDHGKNLETYYGHLSRFLVKSGSKVKMGEPIGLAGATGRATTIHLHFEIRENNRPYNSELVYDFESQTLKSEIKNIQFLADLNHKQKEEDEAKMLRSKKYVVKSGDSLWVISSRLNTTIKNLCLLNDLSENSVLQPGQVLTVN